MRTNWPRLWCAFFWWLIKTQYFGWNAVPSCVEELFADGLVLAMIAAAYARQPQAINLTITTKGDAYGSLPDG